MPDFAAEYGDLPFDRAISFFRKKINLPTKRWNDLWQGQHALGFMTAGAVKADLLTDMREAVDRAIADGTSLGEFQKSFDDIVSRHGWSFRGHRKWRAQLIYQTNVRTAYAAGRWQQMTSPEMTRRRPYLQYRHGDSVVPREQHLSWDGMILPADDPWWKTHYPPNGWGCKCRVFSLSERDLERMGKTGPDRAPETETYTWTDRKTKKSHEVPVGVDPGWDYNVGMAADRSYKELAGRFETLDWEIARAWMSSFLREPAFEMFFAGAIQGEFPVSVLRPEDMAAIGSTTQTVWISRTTLKEHLEKHPEMTIEDYRKIPEIVDNGEVYKHKEERLIYLLLDGVLYRAALKRTVSGNDNYFLTLFKTTDEKADREVRRKYERIR